MGEKGGKWRAILGHPHATKATKSAEVPKLVPVLNVALRRMLDKFHSVRRAVKSQANASGRNTGRPAIR